MTATVTLMSDTDIVVFSPDGIHSIGIAAGDSAEIPLAYVSQAAALGAYPPGTPKKAAGSAAPAIADADKIAAVVEAMRDIIASAVPEKLDAAGIPRLSEIEAIVNFRVTKKIRDEAWFVVEG